MESGQEFLLPSLGMGNDACKYLHLDRPINPMLAPIKPVLPIVSVPLEGKAQKPLPEKLPEMRHWQIEEFLRQTGKVDNI